MVEAALELAFPSNLLERIYPNGKLGGLTLEGKPPGAVGQLIMLKVQFERPSRVFHLKGQLAWARHRASAGLRSCYGIDFIGEHERLLSFARAELDVSALRFGPRLATDLPVRIRHAGQTRKELLVDLSHGGAFVRSGDPLPIGQPVELHVRPPRSLLGFTLRGRVAWHRSTGTAQGFGVEFTEDDRSVRERLEKLLLRLGQS